MAKIIKWQELAEKNGYLSHVEMCVDLYKTHRSFNAVSKVLGISQDSIRRVVVDSGYKLQPKCIHCGRLFEYNSKLHHKKYCDDPECIRKEDIRKRKLKSRLTIERNKKFYDQHKKEQQTKTKPCPECGGPMPESYRFRCPNCWRVKQSSGPAMDDNYQVWL